MNDVTHPRDRRAREKAALRARILDAARGLFVQNGYESVTMRAVARQIGYTAAAIYYHFPDKESLLRELCETDFRSLSDHLKHLAAVKDPVERIRQMGRAYVEFALARPQHYRLMFMTPHPVPATGGIERGNPDQDAYALVCQAVRDGLEGQRFRPELSDAEGIAQALWGGVHGVVSLRMTKQNDPWVDWRPVGETAGLLCDASLRGMVRGGRLPGEGPGAGKNEI